MDSIERGNVDNRTNSSNRLIETTNYFEPRTPDASNHISDTMCSTAKPGRTPRVLAPLDSPVVSMNEKRSFLMKDNTISLRCRICLDSGTEDLVTPCRCTGTIGLIHQSCLEEWLTVAKSGKCEICGFEFVIEIILPGFNEWLKRGISAESRRKHILADLICLVFMVPLVVVCAWLTIHAFKSYTNISLRWEIICLLILFMTIFAVFIIWLVVAFRHHYNSYLEWRISNGRMTIENTLTPFLLLPRSSNTTLSGRSSSYRQYSTHNNTSHGRQSQSHIQSAIDSRRVNNSRTITSPGPWNQIQPTSPALRLDSVVNTTSGPNVSLQLHHHSGLIPPPISSPVPPNMSLLQNSFFPSSYFQQMESILDEEHISLMEKHKDSADDTHSDSVNGEVLVGNIML